MDNMPLILDCPMCLQPLTAVHGVNPNLFVTPCGHLLHEECLPAPRNRHQSQKCMACQKNYNFYECLQNDQDQDQPEVPTPTLTPSTANLLGLPSNSDASPLKTGQEISCGHKDYETGQITLDHLDTIRSIVDQFYSGEEAELMKQICVQTFKTVAEHLIRNFLTSLRQDLKLKRKSSETDQEIEAKRRVIEETSEDQETRDEDEMEVDSEDEDNDEDN